MSTTAGNAAPIRDPIRFRLPVLESVATHGSVGETVYQARPFCSSGDVAVLYPRFAMTHAVAFFLIPPIRQEGKLKYGYGRKWGLSGLQE